MSNPPEKLLRAGTRIILLDMIAGVFEQVAVGHAAGARGFAGAAAQAQVEMCPPRARASASRPSCTARIR